MIRNLLLIVALALVAACSSGESEAPEAAVVPADDTVFDPMTDSLQRAKEAEDLVEQRKDDIDARLKKATGEEPD